MLPELEHIAAPEGSFACRDYTTAGFTFRWHFHPEVELTLILRGSGNRFVGDDIDRFEAGDLVLLGRDLPHTWRSDAPRRGQPHRAIVAQFRTEGPCAAWLGLAECRGITALLARANRGLAFKGPVRRDAAVRMERMMAASPGLPRLVALLETLDLLAASRGGRPLSSARFTAPFRPEQTHRIDRVCRYINDHFQEGLSLAQASAVAHLSESAFSRFFMKMTGRTFKGYLNELRVGAACDLLIRTEDKIAHVASASGFENLSNFNRQFLKRKGISPVAFRRQYSV